MVIKEYSPVVYNAFLIGINELCSLLSKEIFSDMI